MKEDKDSWAEFFKWLNSRGLSGTNMVIGDKCLGMLKLIGEVYPDAKYERCVVHFYAICFPLFLVPRLSQSLKCSRQSIARKARKWLEKN